MPNRDEADVAALVRRSWHAAHALAAGTVLTASDAVLKRPADGMAPSRSPAGSILRHAIAADAPIRAEDLYDTDQ